jgi:hypothetical protein
MRKQYFFRPSDRGLLAWDVDDLIRLSAGLPRVPVPIAQFRELDAVWFDEDERPTWRSFLEHVRYIDEADLAFPIILSASGEVMDGMHRVAKAMRAGLTEIEAVQFAVDPPPTYVGRKPRDLPY